MKRIAYGVAIATCLPLILCNPGFAQPTASSGQTTPAQFQHLSRDLSRSSSEDFFRQGQANLERELILLTKQRAMSTDGILKITNQPLRVPPESTPLKRQDLVPSNRNQPQ
jgi:hypothetical protein